MLWYWLRPVDKLPRDFDRTGNIFASKLEFAYEGMHEDQSCQLA
jgi:hypothetical protein